METVMSTTTGEIQPVVSVPWAASENEIKELQSIPPVTGTEGGTASKVHHSGVRNGANFPVPPPEFSAEVVQQIQFFLKENLGIELNFIEDAEGRTVVEVLESKTGKVIRKIPPEKVSLFGGKIEKLRGILFDGKA
jgi:hypothetical protein